jgi:NADH-quinone oxidoreductase subunit A
MIALLSLIALVAALVGTLYAASAVLSPARRVQVLPFESGMLPTQHAVSRTTHAGTRSRSCSSPSTWR